ncbi:outer membrane beta-barrel protein [Brevundimonas sp. 2R-24]|uniref:Outer membrane beta-barrel protein n=1 Tax=Peiella sedimenti TaxID=3061083 RepID=A0ABT8SLS1_9CAUL|nr:outer membrane beta-barrel protein [Caulobacteraceae bacterium XZ-24]
MIRGLLLASTALAGLALALQPARAQTADQPPPQSPAPVAAQPRLNVDGSISVSAVHTDNVFVTTNNRVGDFITLVEPSLSATLTGNRYQARLGVSADLARYADQTNENYEDYLIELEGRLQLNPAILLFGGVDYSALHEGRQSPDDVQGVRPTEYDQASAFAGFTGNWRPWAVRFGVNLIDLNYDAAHDGMGGVINNDDRDRAKLEVGGRVSYALSPQRQAFVQATLDQRDYDLAVDDLGFQRSSSGYRLAGGMQGVLGRNVTGEVYAGLISQDYDDPRFSDTAALDFGVRADWAYAPRSRISAFLGRTLEETTLGGSPGYLRTSGGISLSRRLSNELQVLAHLEHRKDDYRLLHRADYSLESGVSLRYFFTRRAYLDAGYAFSERNSNQAGNDFNENRITLRLGAQLDPVTRAEDFDPDAAFEPLGFYAGVNAGHGALVTNLTGSRGPGTNTADFGSDGGSFGVFIGHGWTVDEVIHLGLEFEAEDVAQQWDHRAGRTFGVRIDDTYGVTARIGHRLQGDALAYARAGVVSTAVRTPYLHDTEILDRSERETGYRYGVGADFPMTERVFGRFEYVFTTYGDYTIQSPRTSDNFADAQSLLRLGAGYRFGRSAPAAPSAVDFSGFYIGAQFGHGALTSENVGPRPGPDFILDAERSGFGGATGVFAGYGFVMAERFYLGLEVEAGVSSEGWNIERDPEGRVYSVETDEEHGFGLRAGYVLNGASLLYVRAGSVRAQFHTEYEVGPNQLIQDDRRDGLRYGGGVEMGAGPRYRFRVEYTHTDYDEYSATPNSVTDVFANRGTSFRVGFAYRF